MSGESGLGNWARCSASWNVRGVRWGPAIWMPDAMSRSERYTSTHIQKSAKLPGWPIAGSPSRAAHQKGCEARPTCRGVKVSPKRWAVCSGAWGTIGFLTSKSESMAPKLEPIHSGW